ncbi:hypothetical protein AMK16_22595 [Streptomyces sp. CB00455]|uniref:DUF6213 family protein n=1 Tax=Streptomyces sp. CB00455 TaxID=1703927 RepID=UPI000938B262|nr:DUF6213 family protein [Streptomyces sp. CB00455]OKK17585.1 hypothetical protein AMK16_22595 [Streptomyces sp. CB00455]
MIQASIPLIPASDGMLLIPADHVTALLRNLAQDWEHSTDAGEIRADKETALALAGVLAELADQIDVECIGFASCGEEGF